VKTGRWRNLRSERHDMKTYGREEAHLHAFLILALDGGEWSVSSLDHFILEGRIPGTHCLGLGGHMSSSLNLVIILNKLPLLVRNVQRRSKFDENWPANVSLQSKLKTLRCPGKS